MTHEETIRALDELIVYLNNCIVQRNISEQTKKYVIKELTQIGISNTTIQTVACVKIKEMAFGFFAEYNSDFKTYKTEVFDNNKKKILSIINIITAEKEKQESFVEEDARQRAIEEQRKNLELQEKAIAEQKKGNQIQYKAYLCSIFAMLIALVSLIVAICK